ncbi:Ulp1 protease family [Forsythia ovata]|uniref:Ulp1 protease family n=1 Tax=Forsythia ovata TaxID=205694 RepID=A0ABD1QC24_9LAMI
MASSRSGSKSRRKAKRRRNLSGSKRNRGINNGTAKPEKKTVNIPVPEGQTTDTVDADINLEKMTDKGSSHNINFNAKSVDALAAHSCGGKLDKKDCCYSKESIMRSIDALQSKHEQLISDQFTMKMEILNLFTDFANSIVDGIEAVTSIIAVNKFNVSAPPLSDMKNAGGHLIQLCSGDCGIFVIKFAEYIAENKIQEMPKNFDTKVARLNMASQLYKFACEKPYFNTFG